MPHQECGKADETDAYEEKQERIEPSEPESDQGLQYGPMNDVNAIRKVSILREIAEILPEAEDKNQPRYP